MPKNTTLSTLWAMKNFIDWFFEYNIRNPESKCSEEALLPSCFGEVLNKWLSVYVAETRSHTGEQLPCIPCCWASLET